MILENLQFPKKHSKMKIKVNKTQNNNLLYIVNEYKPKQKADLNEEKKKQKPK
jgi:hypothetical protein